MAVSQARRALLVCRPDAAGDTAELLRSLEWEVAPAESFGHAHFLLSMVACEGTVVVDDLASTDARDGMAWLMRHTPAPPLLLAPPAAPITPAVRDGAVWLSPEAARDCPQLLSAALEQAAGIGRLRRAADHASESLRECGQRVDRLLGMIWETAPQAGQPRWFTQRHMLERLDEEVERIRRSGGPLSVVLGELALPGAVLPSEQADRLAGWLSSQVARGKRRCDVTGHYGRHGFLMVLPQTTAEQARGAVQRLRRVLADPPHGPAGIHAYIAVTSAEGAETVPSLLRRAEERLDQVRQGDQP